MSMIARRADGAILTRHSMPARPLVLRRDGAEVDKATISEMLAKARQGIVDAPIEMDIRAYRQQLGQPLTPGRKSMQQHILMRPHSMREHARTYRGRPMLDGHDWGATRNRGGTIDDSSLEVDGDGNVETNETRIVQTITATEPWSVAGILGGTITEFSIGAVITGEIWCSAHNARIWRKCYCYPGELVGEEPGDGEEDKRVRAQWLITRAEGVEVSSVNVPAVGAGATGIDAIRASLDASGLQLNQLSAAWRDRDEASHLDRLVGVADLAALASGDGLTPAEIREALNARRGVYDDRNPATRPRSQPPMSYKLLAAALALTVPTGGDLDEDRAIASLDGIKAERDLYKARAEAAEHALETIREDDAKRDLDVAIAAAYDAGKLARAVGADGKTPVADPQETHLRVIGAGLGLDKLTALLAVMPAQRPPRRTSRAEDTPPPTVTAGQLTPQMIEAARQLKLKPEDMLETAQRNGRVS